MHQCYHCGDDCREEIEFDNKIFCCTGCRTVYELLGEHQLDKFYSLDDKAAIRPSSFTDEKYNYLDLPEIQDQLLIFKEGNNAKVIFTLPQIHCSSCLWLLERLSRINAGVISSQVNFVKKEVTILFDDSKISLKELVKLLAKIGYPPEITLSGKDIEKKKPSNKRLYLQIGLAGFCFGNIMLLSFPEYVGLDSTDHNFQKAFGYLNLMLALPVLIFAAKDYLISAYKSLAAKAINIDVPISLGILALFIRSTFEILSGSGAGYFDSFAGLIFFLLIGKWFQQMTYGAINFERDYQSYFPIAVSRVKGEDEELVTLDKVEEGDTLLIRNNELIPADAIISSGDGYIDYSFVTGESARIRKNVGEKIFAGGRQEGPSILIKVIKRVENSYLTSLWNNAVFAKEKKNARLADQLAKFFTIAVIFIAVGGGIYWSQVDPEKSAFVITSVLIVACPCALALSVPFTYGNSIRILGRRSVYLKSADVIEPMAEVTDIVFDKTGTITELNELQLRWEGFEITDQDKQAIYNICRHSSHPLSVAISGNLKTNQIEPTSLEEKTGLGLIGKFGDTSWKIGSYEMVESKPIDESTRVYVSKNDEILGSFRFHSAYRRGLEQLVSGLNHYQLHILSGDNDAEKRKLMELLPEGSHLQFNQKPDEKLSYIEELQQQGKKVMMIGDGLNDAGALRQSDVGFSVADDVYAFTPSSDGIVQSKQLVALPKILQYAKTARKIVYASYGFSFAYNLVGLYFALTGSLTPLVAAVLMPLSSISVVVLVTLMTNIRGKKLLKELDKSENGLPA